MENDAVKINFLTQAIQWFAAEPVRGNQKDIDDSSRLGESLFAERSLTDALNSRGCAKPVSL
jgi:hypothetical protein